MFLFFSFTAQWMNRTQKASITTSTTYLNQTENLDICYLSFKSFVSFLNILILLIEPSLNLNAFWTQSQSINKRHWRLFGIILKVNIKHCIIFNSDKNCWLSGSVKFSCRYILNILSNSHFSQEFKIITQIVIKTRRRCIFITDKMFLNCSLRISLLHSDCIIRNSLQLGYIVRNPPGWPIYTVAVLKGIL